VKTKKRGEHISLLVREPFAQKRKDWRERRKKRAGERESNKSFSSFVSRSPARALNRDISVSRTSWHKGVILGRNGVFGVFRL
jgi:hypothetical protein